MYSSKSWGYLVEFYVSLLYSSITGPTLFRVNFAFYNF